MKVTIYSKSEFMGNIIKQETKLKSFQFRKYAQYNNALEVIHTPKRKRTTYRKFFLPSCGSPDVLIVEGWNAPEPNSAFDVKETRMTALGEVTTQTSSYSSFDDRFQSDFDSMIDSHIENGLKVVLDVRTGEKHREEFRKSQETV